MKNLFIVLSVLTSFIFFNCKGQTDSEIKNISVQEMKELLKMDDVQLVDVRTPEEYHSGFIANAENMDYFSPSFDEEIKKLDKEKPVVLYCKSGNRSYKSSVKLLELGFHKIYNLDGGIIKWQQEGLDVKKE
ncbi:rhodanese-like domain-containing protein [Gaetbulibacter sp. M235]|uniref:rhodanese-like domain-containing protein n=1 Tax=Gaetbulibacter sp. M235 TaxID=3126510 RepID=UPI00374E2DAA